MSPTRLSRLESSMRIVLEFNEAFNRHDIPGMVARMSDDCIFEDPAHVPDGKKYTGKEAISHYWEAFFRQSPQARMEIEEIFGMGLRCVLRWRCTRDKDDGSIGYIRGVDLFQLRDGAISEQLSYVKGLYDHE